MTATLRAPLTLTMGFAAVLALTACGVDVQDAAQGKNVNIKSVLGDVSVRTDVKNPDTGLRVYPGARTLRKHDDPGSADVSIESRWFGVKVIAANYESEETQEKILEFYRQELKAFGDVTECRGDVDFRGPSGSKRPVCKEKPFSRDVQLVTGTEERQRIVAVKPRGSGTEFSLVYLTTRS
jgi:hypothetical protein